MERMARFSRILLWKVLVSSSPGPTSRFPNHLRGTDGVCGSIGSALLFSPFSACGIDALQEPFGGTDIPRRLQPTAFQLGLPTPAVSLPPPPSSLLRNILSRGRISSLEGGEPPTAAAGRNVGDPYAGSAMQEDKLVSTEMETRDIAGLPEPPPTLDADLERGSEKGEGQLSGLKKSVCLGRGPAQTPEPVAAPPPPLMPSLGTVIIPNVVEGVPQLPAEGGVAVTHAGVRSEIVVRHYFPDGIPITILQPLKTNQ